MTKLFTLAAVGLAALAPLAAAHAATFTESVQFGPGLADFSNATGTTAGPNGNQLYYFDSNGGTLNAITFRYSYAFTSTITVTNFSQTSARGSVRTESGAQFSASDATVRAGLNGAVNTAGDVAFGAATLDPAAIDLFGSASVFSLDAGASADYTSTGNYTSPTLTLTSANILAAFSRAGGGTFTPLLSTLTGTVTVINSGNVGASQRTIAQANLTISYDYTAATVPPPAAAVPEPASWAMMVSGFGLVGAALRRRRTGAIAVVR